MPQAVSQIIMIEKGRLSRAKMIAWSRRQRICAEGESNRVQPLQTLAVRRPQPWLGNRGERAKCLKKPHSMFLWTSGRVPARQRHRAEVHGLVLVGGST